MIDSAPLSDRASGVEARVGGEVVAFGSADVRNGINAGEVIIADARMGLDVVAGVAEASIEETVTTAWWHGARVHISLARDTGLLVRGRLQGDVVPSWAQQVDDRGSFVSRVPDDEPFFDVRSVTDRVFYGPGDAVAGFALTDVNDQARLLDTADVVADAHSRPVYQALHSSFVPTTDVRELRWTRYWARLGEDLVEVWGYADDVALVASGRNQVRQLERVGRLRFDMGLGRQSEYAVSWVPRARLVIVGGIVRTWSGRHPRALVQGLYADIGSHRWSLAGDAAAGSLTARSLSPVVPPSPRFEFHGTSVQAGLAGLPLDNTMSVVTRATMSGHAVVLAGPYSELASGPFVTVTGYGRVPSRMTMLDGFAVDPVSLTSDSWLAHVRYIDLEHVSVEAA